MDLIQVTDQMGREVMLPPNPQRVVSLVPSQTELLFDLGLGDKVFGITKFCLYPEEWRKTKTVVGGTKQVRYEKIEAIRPDLIIGNKEENSREVIERLSVDYPVWMSDIADLDGALKMIGALGEIFHLEGKCSELTAEVRQKFDALGQSENRSAIYLIWKEPWMTAGKGTFIDEMLPYAGFTNVVKQSRYPTFTLDEIREENPSYLLLSSEPFPFQQKHQEELQKLLPGTKVMLVDGEMFSWYGSRLTKAADYLKKIRELG